MISCFETVEMANGRVFALTHHLERLSVCARVLGLRPVDEKAIRQALDGIRAHSAGRAVRVRLSWNDHGIVAVAAPFTDPAPGASVAVHRLDGQGRPTAVDGLKTTNYATSTALKALYPLHDEVIVVSGSGDVRGGLYSNVFLSSGETLVTPTLGSGCRAGVTRELLLELMATNDIRVRETHVTIHDLRSTREVFLCSTTRRVQRVYAIGDVSLPPEAPLTDMVAQLFADLHAERSMWS